jgi:hypothetical protein
MDSGLLSLGHAKRNGRTHPAEPVLERRSLERAGRAVSRPRSVRGSDHAATCTQAPAARSRFIRRASVERPHAIVGAGDGRPEADAACTASDAHSSSRYRGRTVRPARTDCHAYAVRSRSGRRERCCAGRNLRGRCLQQLGAEHLQSRATRLASSIEHTRKLLSRDENLSPCPRGRPLHLGGDRTLAGRRIGSRPYRVTSRA